MSDDLIARAKASSEGFVVPEHWGEAVELEEGGGVFVGRYRGVETDSRGEPVYLFWDEENKLRFFWSAYRLRQGVEREKPALGDTVGVFRDDNYETKYDDPGEPTGIAYGVASEKNDAPLPETNDDDDLPF
jgi:hypothetical protein